tara:strand:+ start:3866 stop:4240 length:375 start_codon:yes stop_codon:yes gene_type:complete
MDKKKDYAYKSIGEVAKLLNLVNPITGKLSTHTLRFWEKEFQQIKPKIFSGRRRYYDENSIEVLKQIKYLLKDQGMTIKGVKKQLKKINSNLDEANNTSINTKNILKSKIKKISKMVRDIKNLK